MEPTKAPVQFPVDSPQPQIEIGEPSGARLPRIRPGRQGRPRDPEAKRRTAGRIHLLINPGLKDSYFKDADSMGITLADWIREAMRRFYAHRKEAAGKGE